MTNRSNKKKIVWVTPDSFLDTDLDYRLMSGVLRQYDIHWIVLFKKSGNRFKEIDFDRLKENNKNLTIEFLYAKHRMRYPGNLIYYKNIYQIIKRKNPDVIYLNCAPHSPYMIPLFLSLPKNKTIIAAHQGEISYGFRFQRLIKCFRNIAYRKILYANLFSDSEAKKFHKHHPTVQVFQINLALKDLGDPTNIRPVADEENPIRFLSFGSIVKAKNIELLIDAACMLYEQGYRNFKVSINGMCDDWSFYNAHIKYPELFETDIRSIPNDIIPNLFNGSHYFVQPYRCVTQSGPMKLAFRYNLPDICSDLPGLKSELKEGVNGFLFKHDDVNDLVRVMKKCIDNHTLHYEVLRRNMSDYIKQHYSYDVIVEKYCQMFETVLNHCRKYGI